MKDTIDQYTVYPALRMEMADCHKGRFAANVKGSVCVCCSFGNGCAAIAQETQLANKADEDFKRRVKMSEHFKSLSAIFPLILRENENRMQILLHRRQNTGYQDGKWDIAGSGHVDKGETAQAAVIRECKEELGIDVEMESLTFVHLSHRIAKDRTYYDIYFTVNSYKGSPMIMEPEKCSEMNWFAIDNLPGDIIMCRSQDIHHYLEGNFYSEKIEHPIV